MGDYVLWGVCTFLATVIGDLAGYRAGGRDLSKWTCDQIDELRRDLALRLTAERLKELGDV
jgi:hypothetical protein